MKKRLLLLALAVATAFAVAGTAFAASVSTTSLSVDKACIQKGETVTVTVSADGATSGVRSMGYEVIYDSELFDYVGGSKGQACADARIATGKPSVQIYGFADDGASVTAGALATFKFTAKADDPAAAFSLKADSAVLKGAVVVSEGLVGTGSVSVEVHTHSYGKLAYDGIGHWNECSCGVKDGFAGHDFGEWEVDKEAAVEQEGSKHRSCRCGYVENAVIPALHRCEFSDEWSCDEAGHWHACAHEGCSERDDFAEHELGEWAAAEGDMLPAGAASAEVRSCSVCGWAEYRNVVSASEPGSSDANGGAAASGSAAGSASAAGKGGLAQTGDALGTAAAVLAAAALASGAALVALRRRNAA